MPADVALGIAHILFMDVIGYSKLLINDQTEVFERLNQVLRQTRSFREAEAAVEVDPACHRRWNGAGIF